MNLDRHLVSMIARSDLHNALTDIEGALVATRENGCEDLAHLIEPAQEAISNAIAAIEQLKIPRPDEARKCAECGRTLEGLYRDSVYCAACSMGL